MRLYFKPADLLLEQSQDGTYSLKMGSELLGRFTQQKRAVAAYNCVRRDLEKKMPAVALTDEDRRRMLESYLADNLLEHNSFRPLEKKAASKKSRTFG